MADGALLPHAAEAPGAARRPVVLATVSCYLPGFKSGGPLRSIANLVAALGHEFAFRVVTTDRDRGDDAPYPGIPTGRWLPVGGAEVLYLPSREQTLPRLARLLRETPHDVLYLNSVLHPRLTTLPLLAQALRLAPRRPVVLAPRGEFSAGALALRPGRKRAFLLAARAIGLHRGVLWQASSAFEAEDIRRAMGQVSLRVASDLPRPPEAPPPFAPRPPGAPLRVAFLSRLSPMKNLDFALRVLARVRVPVDFAIHGPREDAAYWRECEALIAALPPHVRVDVHGAVAPDRVIPTLAPHDLFFLPSRGENFGHAVAEALMAGLPVLVSDRTPWRGLAALGVGHDLPLDDEGAFAARIEAMAALSPEDQAALRARALAEGRRVAGAPEAVEANRQLLLAALASAPAVAG